MEEASGLTDRGEDPDPGENPEGQPMTLEDAGRDLELAGEAARPLDLLVSWQPEEASRRDEDRYDEEALDQAARVARVVVEQGPPAGSAPEAFQWTAERDRALDEALAGQSSLAQVRVVRELRALIEAGDLSAARARIESELAYWEALPPATERYNEAVFFVKNAFTLCQEACNLADQPLLFQGLLEEAESSLERGRRLMLEARPGPPQPVPA